MTSFLQRGCTVMALLLSACAAPPVQHPHGHADVLLSTDRGMRSIAFDARHTYLSLSNSAIRPSAVLQSGEIINRQSVWTDLELGPCRLAPLSGEQLPRSPVLARLSGTIWLFQPATGDTERALCKLERAYEWFSPRDDALRTCLKGRCDSSSLTGLQFHARRLLANAGGAGVLSSADDGASWQNVLAAPAAEACLHGTFRIVGQRLLLGGDCAAGPAALRAFQLSADGLTATQALPVALPDLEQRRVLLIEPGGAPGLMFAGLEGALLRSTDGGSSFRYAIFHGLEARNFPHITSLLTLRKRPGVVLAAGFDKGTGKAYLAVSRDGGALWTDLSAILPGHEREDGHGRASVTSLAQDRVGRVLLTLNQAPDAQGRLLLLTLGGLD